MPLTEIACRNAKPHEKPYKLADEKGLFLYVTPAGGKSWRYKYRFAGKEKVLALGLYPEISIKQAREQHDQARKLLATGIDPAEQKQAKKEELKAKAEAKKRASLGEILPGSFEHVAREWWESVHCPAVSPSHAERNLARLKQNVFPLIGNRPLAQIEPPELLACLRRIVDRGAIETAHRTKDACSQIFRYGIATGLCTRNPASDLKDALPPTGARHLAAITDPEEAGKLLRAIAGYKGGWITRIALQLSALLFLRPGELRQLEWEWVNWEEAMLQLPSALMKRRKAAKLNGNPHLVPLARQSLELLRELQGLTGSGRLMFPSMLSNKRPMSENTVNTALRRLGYSNDVMTAHGFRAMARTMAAERLDIQPQVIEAQLAHEVPDALGRAYNRTQFIRQRRDLMQVWADYLDQLAASPQSRLSLQPSE
jgi:integrase